MAVHTKRERERGRCRCLSACVLALGEEEVDIYLAQLVGRSRSKPIEPTSLGGGRRPMKDRRHEAQTRNVFSCLKKKKS